MSQCHIRLTTWIHLIFYITPYQHLISTSHTHNVVSVYSTFALVLLVKKFIFSYITTIRTLKAWKGTCKKYMNWKLRLRQFIHWQIRSMDTIEWSLWRLEIVITDASFELYSVIIHMSTKIINRKLYVYYTPAIKTDSCVLDSKICYCDSEIHILHTFHPIKLTKVI